MLKRGIRAVVRIAFVIDTIESPTAGTEKQLLLLLKHLDRSRFQPILCVMRSSLWLEEEFDICPLHVADIDSFKKVGGLTGVVRLSRFFKREGVRVVQTHFRDASIAGILAARLAGVKSIVATRRNQGYWLTPTELNIQKFLNRWVTVFIANSISTKHWVTQTEGVAPERVEVIYNAIDLVPFGLWGDADRLAVRRDLGISEKTAVVGIVANLRPVKGLDVFLRAAAAVRQQISDIRFLVVGEGSERPRLEALSRELGIDNVVSFLGRREDVERLLTAFDIGVLSSHSESFSNAVVEYLAAGLPVVCTDVGGCREAVQRDWHGKIVVINDHPAMAEAIATVLASRNGAKRTDTIEWVRKLFDLQVVIKKYHRFYTGLVASK